MIKDGINCCSFCMAHQGNVPLMVKSDFEGVKVFICSDCIARCVGIMGVKLNDAVATVDFNPTKK